MKKIFFFRTINLSILSQYANNCDGVSPHTKVIFTFSFFFLKNLWRPEDNMQSPNLLEDIKRIFFTSTTLFNYII